MTTETLVHGYVLTNTPKDLFQSREHYLSFISSWKKFINSKEIKPSSYHFALYHCLRGKDWRKAFSPMTNKKKVENQKHSCYGSYYAFYMLRSICKGRTVGFFDETITKEMIDKLLLYLPDSKDFMESGYYSKLPSKPYKEVK